MHLSPASAPNQRREIISRCKYLHYLLVPPSCASWWMLIWVPLLDGMSSNCLNNPHWSRPLTQVHLKSHSKSMDFITQYYPVCYKKHGSCTMACTMCYTGCMHDALWPPHSPLRVLKNLKGPSEPPSSASSFYNYSHSTPVCPFCRSPKLRGRLYIPK